jgi:hypothetical protein
VEDNKIFIMNQSLSGTAFYMFHNYMETDEIYPITSMHTFTAAKSSQRGGRTSVLDYSE